MRNSRTGLNQKVLWFNVSVEDTQGVKLYQGINQLPQNDLQKERQKEKWYLRYIFTFIRSFLNEDDCDELVCTSSPWHDPLGHILLSPGCNQTGLRWVQASPEP